MLAALSFDAASSNGQSVNEPSQYDISWVKLAENNAQRVSLLVSYWPQWQVRYRNWRWYSNICDQCVLFIPRNRSRPSIILLSHNLLGMRIPLGRKFNQVSISYML
jgi:hypothetical protein